MKVVRTMLMAMLMAGAGCTAIVDFTQCDADGDCESGTCSDDGICVGEVQGCQGDACDAGTCEGDACDAGPCEGDTCDAGGCLDDQDCTEPGTVCDLESGQCVMPEPVSCELDSECEVGQICTDSICQPGQRCGQLAVFVEQMWSDFEIEGFTSVEGFREPLNDQTSVEDVVGEGAGGGTVARLSYDLSGEQGITGYRMYAFPSADMTGMEELVIRARADREIDGIRLRILDTTGVEGGDGESFTTFSLQPAWREIRLPLDRFLLPEENVNRPDPQAFQLIEVLFAEGNTSAEQGVVDLDIVGFRGPAPAPNQADTERLIWSNFEIEGFTNVEGFREPLNEGTSAADRNEGPDGQPAVELTYDANIELELTGYILWAFPFADVSLYDTFYMVARSTDTTRNVELEFFDKAELDNSGDGGWASIDVSIGNDWDVIWFPLSNLSPRGASGEAPDWTTLQRINLVFRDGRVCPEKGQVVISEAGFVRRSAP